MSKQKGFTLIELLVVVAIIGLLSTLAVLALGSARQKARDAKRVADVQQLRSALELYYADNNQYPDDGSTPPLILGLGAASCLDNTGFQTTCSGTTYMGNVPRDPSMSGSAGSACTGASSAVCEYAYTSASSSEYSVSFYLESGTGGLAAGAHAATQDSLN